MAKEPDLVEASRIPPPLPTIRTCPAEYVKYKSACFRFGSHSSYEEAKTSCEVVGARLANVEQTFSKYILNQVRTMGGNDFWIGSFINRGKTYKQKGRTSCPIMRGQMINDALYGLVDCNSANRFICQKYGPVETTQRPFNLDPNLAIGGEGSKSKDKTAATEAPEQGGDGGLSPVIYVVITAVILILVLVALKLLLRKYFRGKRKNKSTTESKTEMSKEDKSAANVFFPKRKQIDSKRTSLDSAVPPSNPSPSLSTNGRDRKTAQDPEGNELERMTRPRVNGSVPTRKPPHEIGEFLCSYHGRTLEKNVYDRNTEDTTRHRRTYSDPRSDFSHPIYHHRSRRKRSYLSEYSQSTTNSESDDSNYSGHRYGPTKVYQRHPSRSRMEREPLHYHIEPRYIYGPPQRDYREHRERRHRSRSKNHPRLSHVNVYYNDGHGRYISHVESRYGNYGRRDHYSYDTRRQSRVTTVSQKVAEPSFERQYFPQPHRLMSWTTPAELTDVSRSTEPLVQEKTLSIQKEPIRVSRQIHQPQKKHGHKRSKRSKSKDENHIYETLDEARRNKQLKKAAKRNRAKKKSEDRHFNRASQSRVSARSMASIQSRRLPTPPT